MHILELVEQAERDDWMGSHGWVKPTSFHCVIELVGVCVSEGEREVLQVRLCMCVERERERTEGVLCACEYVCGGEIDWPPISLMQSNLFLSLLSLATDTL